MKDKKQLAEFLSEKLKVDLKPEAIYNLLVKFQSEKNGEDYREEEDRHMTWEECENLSDRIIKKNKKEIEHFKESIIKDIEDLEIGLSMGGYLLTQREVPKEIRAEVIRKKQEKEKHGFN